MENRFTIMKSSIKFDERFHRNDLKISLIL